MEISGIMEKKGAALDYQDLGKHSPSGWIIMLLSDGRPVCYHFTVCQPVPWGKAIKWSSGVSWTEFQTQGLEDQCVQPAISLVSHKRNPSWRRGCDRRQEEYEGISYGEGHCWPSNIYFTPVSFPPTETQLFPTVSRVDSLILGGWVPTPVPGDEFWLD